MDLVTYQNWLCKHQWQGAALDAIVESVREPASLRSLFILTNGLAGETGETLEHFKKLVRDGKFDQAAVAMELGDVLAYLTWLSKAAGYTLNEIAEFNYLKLTGRIS